jgi:trans-2,3-dihydro-3-hydroxyanthranilate isomerase
LTHRFLHFDVFSANRLEGNQLAVVFEAADISDATLQAVAREMAFPETVFVLPAQTPQAVARLRIFTPGVELPMAGHPTIGSTFALAHEGRITAARSTIVLDLGVGPTRIDLEWSGSALAFAWMSQSPPRFGPALGDRHGLAETLGLAPDDLAPRLPVQVVSCGLEYLLVPLASRDAVDRASLEARGLRAFCRRTGIDEQAVYVFSLEASDPDVTAYSRMFAPAFGIAEDPATGSAAGPLGCYLVQHRAVPPSAQSRMTSLQGVRMRRPSRIAIAIDGEPGAITAVRVGGTSVLVAEGVLYV